jgi:hypothetical protein
MDLAAVIHPGNYRGRGRLRKAAGTIAPFSKASTTTLHIRVIGKLSLILGEIRDKFLTVADSWRIQT